MAHEDVLVSVGAEGCLLLDDGVGDVLVTEDVILVLAGRVYLVLVTPVARAVLRVGTNIIIQSNSILILSFDNILIIPQEVKWMFSTCSVQSLQLTND